MSELHQQLDWEKSGGIVPAIIQHTVNGRVLMLGYMNADALAKTQASGSVTFYSRSRQCLWTKGETSGNMLKLVGIEVDCDNDALLVSAMPAGPTCHLDKTSCFDRHEALPGFGFIGQLESIIAKPRSQRGSDSYTTRLLDAGVQRIAQKVGEEGVEVALAAVTEDRQAIIGEVADLIYHVLVLLHHQELSLSDVAQQLLERHREHQTA